MAYDPSNPPKYLRQTTTGRIYAFSTFKAARADMEAYEMPEAAKPTVLKVDAAAFTADTSEEASKIQRETAEEFFADIERTAAIKSAIAQIPVENYGKPTMGKPALPKVAEVSGLAGFKVSAEEILAIVKE